jgi:hypothetical protein
VREREGEREGTQGRERERGRAREQGRVRGRERGQAERRDSLLFNAALLCTLMLGQVQETNIID